MSAYVCPNGHEIDPVVAVRCETPGCVARVVYEPSAHALRLHGQLREAEAYLKTAIGCVYPETCGGPLRQPFCEPCLAFAGKYVWTTREASRDDAGA